MPYSTLDQLRDYVDGIGRAPLASQLEILKNELEFLHTRVPCEWLQKARDYLAGRISELEGAQVPGHRR